MYSHSSARRWDEALRVMEQLQTVGLQPSRVTFSTAVSTLGRALHWRWAQSLFDSMRRRHSVVTFGAVIGVCERGSQWQGALAQLDRLEARGERSAHRVAVQAVGREFRCGMSWEGRKASKEVFGVQHRDLHIRAGRLRQWRRVAKRVEAAGGGLAGPGAVERTSVGAGLGIRLGLLSQKPRNPILARRSSSSAGA